jgi:LysM repeat protein
MNIKRNITAAHLGTRLILGGRPFVGGICLHDTAGSGTHNDTLYLSNPGDGRVVSVDFTVERDGTIYQLNPDLTHKCTWHAGRATKFVTAGRVLRNQEVTKSLIGIELVQKNDLTFSPVWPDVQVDAVAELCLWLCIAFKLTKEQITTHAKIITDGSRSDPRRFPFEQFWSTFNRNANTPAVDPKPDAAAVGSPTYYVVVSGDSLWKIAKQFGVTVEALKANNGMATASNLITPGQKLLIRK